MTDTTVQEFAEVVGTDSDRLLSQMKEAGLPQTNADDAVSAEQKEALLGHLKKNHGDAAEAEPKKISLKRKTTSTLKTGQGGKKEVAVEVRKKRTFVKPDADEVAAAVEEKVTAVKVDKAVVAEAKQAAEAATAEAKAAAAALDAAAVAQAAAKAKSAAEAKKIKPVAKHKISQKSQSEAKARGDVGSTARVAAKAKVAAKPKPEAKPKATAAAKPKTGAKPKLSAKPVARDTRNKKPTATAATKTVPLTKEELAQKQATADAANKKRASGAPASAPRAGAPSAPRAGAPSAPSAPRAGAPGAPRTGAPGAPRSGAPRQFRTEDGSANQRGRRKKLKGKAARTAQAQADNEHSFTKPTAPVIHQVELPESITAGELAAKMAIKAGDVIKSLMGMGVMATINQTLDQDTATLVVEE
ncbi:MAG: translation initiation factor IF-2, partial [Oleispira sp.]